MLHILLAIQDNQQDCRRSRLARQFWHPATVDSRLRYYLRRQAVIDRPLWKMGPEALPAVYSRRNYLLLAPRA